MSCQQTIHIGVSIVVVFSEKGTEIIKKEYGLPPKSRISSRLLTTLCGLRTSPTIQQSQTVTCPTLLMAKVKSILQHRKKKPKKLLKIKLQMPYNQHWRAAEQETNTEPTEAQKEVAFSTGNVKGKTDGKGKTKPFEEFSEGERTLWQKIKATVLRLLDKFHGSLKLPKWFELGDNELRYILWRSKERLERGKEHQIDLARDIVKRKEPGLGEGQTVCMCMRCL